jgi:hypothetical protein
MPKTIHIQHFSGELKFTAIECIIQEGSIIFIYNEPTQKLVEPKQSTSNIHLSNRRK